MEKYNVLEKIREAGFEVKPHERDGINGLLKLIYYYTTPDINLIIKLLLLIKKKYKISFFDLYHPQISDPGAYCSAVVINEDTVAYMLGNHGWSSEWKKIPIWEFAKYLQKNWGTEDWSGVYKNYIQISENLYYKIID